MDAEPDLFGGAIPPLQPLPPAAAAVATPVARSRKPVRASRASPGEAPESAISVATLTQTVKDVVEGAFPPIWVRGEVSGFKQYRSGHWYFTLRGGDASVRCVVWARDTWRMPAPPDEGMAVVALGEVTVYTARGDLQLSVRRLDAVGDGLWRKAFELTRASLDAAGLLAPERKRALPPFPRRIAVVTSADGAALHDIVSVVQRRNPLVEIVLIPAVVQGDAAPSSLCAALDRLERWGGADVAIVGRGGGSREDLWAFNDERVARRLAALGIPTISAIGHEVDVSICDLVADWRAPTPSAAAERAVPVLGELRQVVAYLGARLQGAVRAPLEGARHALERSARQAASASRALTERRRLEVGAIAGRLHALSPLATLSRGYAVVSDEEGSVITSVDAMRDGSRVDVRFRDGRARARVESVDRSTLGRE